MKENNLFSVNQIYHIEISKIMQKYALKSIPTPFYDIFHRQIRTSNTAARSATTVIQAPSSTSKCAQSIRCTGPKIWNSVPREIRYNLPEGLSQIDHYSPTQLKPFLSKLKSHVIQNVDFI